MTTPGTSRPSVKDKRKSLSRISGLFSFQSKSTLSSPTDPVPSLPRKSLHSDFKSPGDMPSAWPLFDNKTSSEKQAKSQPATLKKIQKSSMAPMLQLDLPSISLAQTTSRPRSASFGHVPSSNTSQSTSPRKDANSPTELHRPAPTISPRKSTGTLRNRAASPPLTALPQMPKSPPVTNGGIVRQPSSALSLQRVDTSLNFVPTGPARELTVKKKRGLFSAKPKSAAPTVAHPSAWIAGAREQIPYDVALLASGAKVPELWQENGNALVYLFPPSAGRGPSFRLSSEILASSPALTALAHGEVYSIRAGSSMSFRAGSGVPFVVDPRTNKAHLNSPGGFSAGVSPNTSYTDGSEDSRESRGLVDYDAKLIHIRLPIALSDEKGQNLNQTDIRNLVSVRNLFAFLVGQSLVATPAYPTVYDVFVQIAKHLLEFNFSNMDGSTFGETPDSSFMSYLTELRLLDMRNRPEKIIEGLLLGAKMRSAVLWNEAFVHAAGLYEDLQKVYPMKFKMLPPVAIQRLERAHMDLEKRIHRINGNLTEFEYPAVFSGIMNSRMAVERDVARFEDWKTSFQAARRFLLQHLKGKFGSWPPKKDKKNPFTLPVLNRRVLKILETDLNMLYDLLVDRKHPSSRLVVLGQQFAAHPDRRIEALRKVLRECDESGSPVYPTMPFDAPLLPRLNPSQEENERDLKKKVSKTDLINILSNSYNQDTKASRNSFVNQWMAFELKSTSGVTIEKVANFRLGAWLFLYNVLQTLPMLVVDAPGIQFVDNVDYFLCQAPRGRLPWSRESTQTEWFRDPVTGTLTQMSKEAIELSLEAIYRMSHCWKASEVWEQDLPNLARSGLGSIRQPQHQIVRSPSHGRFEVPPQIDVNGANGWSAKSSPMITQQFQHSPYHQNGYPTPPYGPVYDLPYHNSTPNLHTPPLQPIQEQNYSNHNQHPSDGSHPSPLIIQPWDSHQQNSLTNSPSRYSPPNLPNVSEPSLLPPPILTGHAPGSGPNSRSSSPYSSLGRRGGRESILLGGLERLPVPGPGPMSREDRAARTPSMTFEDILPVKEVKRGRVPSRTGWI